MKIQPTVVGVPVPLTRDGGFNAGNQPKLFDSIVQGLLSRVPSPSKGAPAKGPISEAPPHVRPPPHVMPPPPKENNDPGSWDATGGTPPVDAFKILLKQGKDGICIPLGTIAGLLQSDQGVKLLQSQVKVNQDGSYDVRLHGAPDYVQHITSKELQEFHDKTGSTSDKPIDALLIGLDRQLKQDEYNSGITDAPGERTDKLLLGNHATADGIDGATAKPQAMRKFIEEHAPGSDSNNKALMIGGHADEKGEWSAGDKDHPGNHNFYVKNYDKASGTVTIGNPWDTSKDQKILISDLSEQACHPGVELAGISVKDAPETAGRIKPLAAEDKRPGGDTRDAKTIIAETPLLASLGDRERQQLKGRVGDYETDPDAAYRAEVALSCIQQFDESGKRIAVDNGDNILHGFSKAVDGDAQHGTAAGRFKDFVEQGYDTLK